MTTITNIRSFQQSTVVTTRSLRSISPCIISQRRLLLLQHSNKNFGAFHPELLKFISNSSNSNQHRMLSSLSTSALSSSTICTSSLRKACTTFVDSHSRTRIGTTADMSLLTSTGDNRRRRHRRPNKSVDHDIEKNDDALLRAALLDSDDAVIDQETLERLARERPTPLNLADMYKYGGKSNFEQRLRYAQFLHKEIPIRIAHRTIDLLTLPHGLSEAKPIQQVANNYMKYLLKLVDFPTPITTTDEMMFTNLLQSIVSNRDTIPHAISAGVQEWQQSKHLSSPTTSESKKIEVIQEMEDALYRFFTARVGLRFLAEHYVLSSPMDSAKELWKTISMFPIDSDSKQMQGCIQPNVDVVEEVHKVVDLVQRQAKEFYGGLYPEIEVKESVQQKFEFTHVPHHLQYMLYELLKNSCRASIRKYQSQKDRKEQPPSVLNKVSSSFIPEPEIPEIRIIIVMGEEDVTIKVADRGGGIRRSSMNSIWKFAHSTASKDESNTAFGRDGLSGTSIRGFGLPLARIYARYFGGELTLKSTEGYGLDAYLHIPRLGNKCENLPLRVRDSPGEHDSMPIL